MSETYIYPAVLHYAADGISIGFPDLPGCLPCAHSDAEAFRNASEALELHLWSLERDGEAFPAPTPVERIATSEHEVVILVSANMTLTRMQLNNRSVRKMVSLPQWLNDIAEESGLNFSQVLQEGLKTVLDVQTPDDAAPRRGRPRKSA